MQSSDNNNKGDLIKNSNSETKLWSKGSEESLLGILLTSSEVLTRTIGYLSPEDFFLFENRELYKILIENHNSLLDASFFSDTNSFSIDLNLVYDKARAKNIEKINPEFISRLLANAGFTSQADSLVIQISKYSQLRKIQVGLNEAQSKLDNYDGVMDKSDLANFLENVIYDTNDNANKEFDNLKDASQDYFEKFQDRLKNNIQITGVPTGFRELDRTINGLNQGALIILAARPGVGKTTFALNVILNVLQKKSFRESDSSDELIDIIKFDPDKIDENNINAPGKRIVLFSLEMPTQQIVEKLYSRKAMIPLMKLKNPGIMNEAEKMNILKKISDVNEHEFKNYQLFIDDGTSSKISTLAWKIRTLNRRQKIDLVVVDYLQLLSDEGNGNRQNEISVISRSLKRLAIELNIPIIALSQLSRKVEERADKRPIISDLRESGSIEQDADIVMFLYQQDNKNKDETIENADGYKLYPVELLIKKHRAGEQKDLLFYFNKSTGDFVSGEDYTEFKSSKAGDF
ncbi:replicative DNA helicase [Mycoplasma phocimorsus]|uniref:replicative DNA helicase n=1 Tax=Mycoplasma phocimorsus TaxID=3045839 RepID=UPI0024C0E363|nr:DnaB-like helicase C-terminal domain-containing protein [Mycoplasma phocimorsus]MDJ1646167.1 DnaB-like helicase C-terminal domain-containing protein [Mycoplasma phocimorsus]MDJ1648273.1 DnaB-like helicase C-terminal domain-containing protein [Mycoplasma phocimorsus]MDJ1648704.1 DnaB-like helicase C-terminal domain-containing protein [Mycoplasma phocimorsus]